MGSSPDYDVIIIGGGAAGFFSAIQVAEATYDSASILLLEKTSQTLTKVKVSGGGRCNVTHSCFDPKALIKNYPRGEKSLIGPFHHFQPSHMIEWLEDKGIELKTEEDGRIFPVTNDSQTVIDCMLSSAKEHNITIKTNQEVTAIKRIDNSFSLSTSSEEIITCSQIVVATGGSRLSASSNIAELLGHKLLPPVPSLFTFNIKDQRIEDIAGISVPYVKVSVPGTKLNSEGPVLVTHWGLSGPAILKLSAWGARSLYEANYSFKIHINWSPNIRFQDILPKLRDEYGKRTVSKRSPFESIPRRLWEKLTQAAAVPTTTTWAQLTNKATDSLIEQIHNCCFQTNGKSINKDEFVTCGGVPLQEIHTKTFESKCTPDCYFTGEVLDIDGVTGGFNFQNAWTTSYLAAQAIAYKILER